jgi:outer membrane protein assembly factor BamB
MAKRLPSLHWLFAVSFCLFGVFISIEPAQAQVNVTTYHYDNARTGQNTQETVLTPANVGSTVFGKLFSVPVDGAVYAQPLILTNVMVAAVVHNNVSYVATEHDSVYAIDSDNGTILWQVSFINPAAGITTIPSADVNCTDIQPEVGITATPVIDPVGGALYVMALTKENGSYAQTLHALDVTSGAEMFGGPVLISASVLGSGDGTDGINVSFNPLTAGNRSALLLENGHVIIGWASYCDNGPYHGWVMSYSATTLAQEAVFNTTPNAGLGGVWMSGAGERRRIGQRFQLQRLFSDRKWNLRFQFGLWR